jgi:hypothetical protein
MLKIPLDEIKHVAKTKDVFGIYADELISAGVVVSLSDVDYLLISRDAYEFFAEKYKKWPNSTSGTEPSAAPKP